MICLDASVIVKLLLSEEFSSESRDLYYTAFRNDEPVVAPPTMPFEVVNTLYQRAVQGEFSATEADAYLADFFVLRFDVRWERRLHRESLHVAARFGIGASYDADYIVLAQQANCAFWTDDRKLLRQLRGRLPFVHWIGELAKPDDEA